MTAAESKASRRSAEVRLSGREGGAIAGGVWERLVGERRWRPLDRKTSSWDRRPGIGGPRGWGGRTALKWLVAVQPLAPLRGLGKTSEGGPLNPASRQAPCRLARLHCLVLSLAGMIPVSA